MFLDNKIKETLNETIRQVIDEELNSIISDPKGHSVNVEEINEKFLKANATNKLKSFGRFFIFLFYYFKKFQILNLYFLIKN